MSLTVAEDQGLMGATMTRENATAKGHRYLIEGRLTVTLVAGDEVRATCRGGGVVHELGHSLARSWWCSCPARSTCCHLAALMLVSVVER